MFAAGRPSEGLAVSVWKTFAQVVDFKTVQ